MALKSLSTNWHWCLIAVAAFMVLSLGGWYGFGGSPPYHADPLTKSQPSDDLITVDVVSPRAGGIERVCLQPGSLEPIEAADLYAKVSGYLVEQHVDIGQVVREGQVLAKLWVPEYETQVKQDAADVVRALAKVDQMNAGITTAKADLGAAGATVGFAKADKKSKAAFRAYREKQRDRIQELVARQALEAKLEDEQEGQYQAAVAADLAAEEAISSAKQKEAAARARVTEAQADLRYAEAEVATAKARLEKSQVLLNYTTIKSPYHGVVTKRNFHRGDFVRSADAGGDRMPLLAVERTDSMRVVIQIPERDVPFVDCGDPAVVEVDALPGVVFKSNGAEKVAVTCMAASEDPHTRMMRTEVHLKNPNGKLRRGMFGRVALTLQIGAPNALRIPSSALTGKADGGKGTVRVVTNDTVHFVPVQYGADNGSEVEVLSGLAPTDRVIVRASGAISEGNAVKIANAKAPSAGH